MSATNKETKNMENETSTEVVIAPAMPVGTIEVNAESVAGLQDARNYSLLSNTDEQLFVNHFNLKSSNSLANGLGKVFLPYQSEMTHIWANDILKKGSYEIGCFQIKICQSNEFPSYV